MEISSSILRPETKLVIMDLDGTLYSKRGMAWRIAVGDWLEAPLLLKERRVRKAMRGQWFGDGDSFYKAFFENIIRHRLCTVSFVRWWYFTCYMPLMVNVLLKYKPRPWVVPFVEACHRMGVRVVVLSDYDMVEEKLEALGLSGSMFDWVAAAPALGGLKPAPQLMTVVAERMGVRPSQCLVLGDREDTDGALAHATGAQFYLIK